MFFPKSFLTLGFGLVGAAISGSVLAASYINKENKPILEKKCTYSKDLEEIFSEIKNLYDSFKSVYLKSKDNLPKEKLSEEINDSNLSSINNGSCFEDYWYLLYNLLKPLQSYLRDNYDSKFQNLKKSTDNLSNKINQFYKQNGLRLS